ncbi:sulfurtransferase [Actinokineospora auranticolor]|uniref:Thiosulfate/3-mercaptopyruvate sulfurtransferase n=1 Tax=Actinokineospora auranticolor TaxID=155976 RepID=A0A2S6GC67_9PSEU|nr:sulfurtransferase [Actinokineospora auranticolor]PPK62200.1 thiosulfate/3-mercaptopyruvate sulfurtransferase [Actinokineospora auranticolor]
MQSPLVSVEELVSLLDSARAPVVLDVRWRLAGPPGREDYQAGHLPGAVFVDLDTALAAPPGDGGRHPLPDPDVLAHALRAAGVRADTPVVAYDSDNGSVAARAWWLLRWAGHREVAVLDGGYAAWTAAGQRVTTEVPTPPPGDFTVTPGHMPVIDAPEAAALATNGLLLDARAPERYRGEVEPIDPRAGHVPGAVNAPFTAHTTPDGLWHPAETLATHYRALGVTDTTEVGTYCGSGVTASSVVLALEVAGLRGPDSPAALYAGSWSHWSRNLENPVETT